MAAARRRFFRLLVGMLSVGALLLAVLQPLAGTRADFSIFNTRWNGASLIASDLHDRGALETPYGIALPGAVSVAYRSLDLRASIPAATTVLVVGPDRAPSAGEAQQLAAFVAAGGQLLVADDFGHGNEFLAAAGATMRFDTHPVKDLAYSRQSMFVVADAFQQNALTLGLSSAVLDAPSSLVPGSTTTVLARTAASAWRDTNADGLRQATEQEGPFTWLATEAVGQGVVVGLADPSALINGMAGVGSDARLRTNLVDWATVTGRSVVWDEAHRGYPDPVRWLDEGLAARSGAFVIVLAVLSGALAFALVVRKPGRVALAGLRARWAQRFAPPTEEVDVVALALRRDPTLDENALRNILRRWSDSRGGH